MRRRFGLSQARLAELLRVGQATVSRWERGIEPIGERLQFEILDLFSNRHGDLDGIIRAALRRHRSTCVFDSNHTCLHVSQFLADFGGYSPAEMIGRNYKHVAETEWFSEIYGEFGTEQRIYTEFDHQYVGTGRFGGVTAPVRARQFGLQFEGRSGLMLAFIHPAPPVSKPRLISRVTIADFEQSPPPLDAAALVHDLRPAVADRQGVLRQGGTEDSALP